MKNIRRKLRLDKEYMSKDLALGVLSICLYLFDVFSDVKLAAEYYRQPSTWIKKLPNL